MTVLYVFIVILNILLISVIFLKSKFQFKYEINDVDTIISYICISIWKLKIYEKIEKNNISNIIGIYLKNNKEKEKKIDIDLDSAKNTLKEIIKETAKEKINLNIYFGIKDSTLPIYIIPTCSTIFSIYLLNNVKQKYIKNIHYNIYPNYIRTYILIDMIVNFRLLSLIKMFYLKNKYKEEKYGKSSN